MSSFSSNCVWDKNGACVQCGYMPFDLTDKCYECNPEAKQKININNVVQELENCLHEQGVNFLTNYDVSIMINSEKEYNELDKLLKEYKHLEYVISPLSGKPEFDPYEQMVIRVQEYLKYGVWRENMEDKIINEKEDDDDDEDKYNELTEKYFPNGIPIKWELDPNKESYIIDEDKSSYDDMYNALYISNKDGDIESVHFIEDQLYRRFIKDIVNGQLSNNDIKKVAEKIKSEIIDPNEGEWESCRWYS